jgi:uncharacterized radical SAM superfamily Fe-S cluster-containing enzyme
MIIKSTISFCPTCYKRIPADIYAENGSVYMRKFCSEHGQTVGMVERDVNFYNKCLSAGTRGIYSGYLMDVTERCNIKCKFCYRGPSNSKDPSIQRLVQEAIMARGFGQLIITGGEPTVREDLPQLLEQLNCVSPGNSMLTNGIRMDDKMLDAVIPYLRYWDKTVGINLSMHPESNGADRRVIQMMRERGLKLESILWVIDDLSQIDEVIEFATQNKDVVAAVRLKAASKLWAEQKPENHIFVSDMLKYLKDPEPVWWANNKVSFFNISINNIHFMLVSWYNVGNIDILDINCPPVYKSKIGLIENLTTACIVNEGLSKGWVDGIEVKNAPV